MKLLTLCSTMIAVTLLLTVGPALGQITESEDSINFANKYEFDVDDVLPSGFSSAGIAPTVANDTMSVDTSADAADVSYLISSSSQTWGTSGITWTTGYTVEMKLRVDSIAEGAAYAVSADNIPVGGSGDGAWLNISPDGQAWGYPTRTTMGLNNNSDDFHVFRFAQEPETSSYSVWRDDVLIASEIGAGWNHGSALRMLIGDGGGLGGGAYEMDYFRFTSGAYKPVNEIIPDPVVPTASKDSGDFTYKYEMDVDPTDPLLIDLDDNDAPDWANSATALATTDGNILTVPDGATLSAGHWNTDGIWPTAGFTAEDGFTYEVSMQVQQNEGEGILNSTPIAFALKDSPELGVLTISADSISWDYATILTDVDNTDGQHTYRISRDSNAVEAPRWWVWRDGVLLTPEGDKVGLAYTRDATYMGSGISGASSGTQQVDYIRMTDGTFAPVDISTLLPGDANNDGVVNDLDATALADNWQTQGGATWSMGDFNNDGNVDDIDATILATNWQTTTSASVPEPGILTLLALASMGLLLMRHKAA